MQQDFNEKIVAQLPGISLEHTEIIIHGQAGSDLSTTTFRNQENATSDHGVHGAVPHVQQSRSPFLSVMAVMGSVVVCCVCAFCVVCFYHINKAKKEEAGTALGHHHSSHSTMTSIQFQRNQQRQRYRIESRSASSFKDPRSKPAFSRTFSADDLMPDVSLQIPSSPVTMEYNEEVELEEAAPRWKSIASIASIGSDADIMNDVDMIHMGGVDGLQMVTQGAPVQDQEQEQNEQIETDVAVEGDHEHDSGLMETADNDQAGGEADYDEVVTAQPTISFVATIDQTPEIKQETTSHGEEEQ